MSARVPSVSIVIVNWNACDQLLGCLESIKSQEGTEIETILVDNASTDGTVQRVRASSPWVTLIANTRNVGLAAANNQGMALASGDVVVISNPDVLFRPGSVRALVDILSRRPAAGMAFARLLESDGSVQTAAGTLPTFREAMRGRNAQAAARRQPPARSFWWDGWAHNEEIPIGHGGEACYAVRRSLIDDIGPQDERFVLDWEGIDWCRRALEAGWELWFCPGAEVTHVGSRSITKARLHWIIASHRGMYYYFATTTPRVLRPFLALAIASRAVIKAAAVALGRGFYSRHVKG